MVSPAALAWTGAAFGLGVLIVARWQFRAIEILVSRHEVLNKQMVDHCATMAQISDDVAAAIGGQVAAIETHQAAMKQVNALLSAREPAAQFKDLNNQLQCKIRPIRPARTEIETKPPEGPQPC